MLINTTKTLPLTLYFFIYISIFLIFFFGGGVPNNDLLVPILVHVLQKCITSSPFYPLLNESKKYMIWKISLNDFFIISGIIHVSLIVYHIDHNKQSSLLQLYLVYRCMKLMQTQNPCFYFGFFFYSYILIWFETFGQEIVSIIMWL